MSRIEKDCERYSNFEIIGNGSYGNIYKAQNKETKYYVAIKEINKQKYNNQLNIKENNDLIKEVIENEEYYYIIMELCYCNLEEYIIRRENKISINELREVLIQVNNIIKEKKIIYSNLKTNHILISLKKLDKCIIKISNYLNSSNHNNYPLSPEILKSGKINDKSGIWNLGIIIYFILNKEYPYNGENKQLILKDIFSEKKLKLSENKHLNDLMNKMLKTNINERISWEEYLNHPFFKENNQFNKFKCKIHMKDICYYCINCKINICKSCFEHSFHEVIPYYKIGVKQNELNKMEDILKEIDDKLNSFIKIKQDIVKFINKVKLIDENKSIYDNDTKNNYKEYLIEYLEETNKNLRFNEININELIYENKKSKNEDNNYIICLYDIKNNEKKKKNPFDNPCRLLNTYENYLRETNCKLGYSTYNEQEIKENCELFIDNQKISFCYKYDFFKEGKYMIKFVCKESLINTNLMFYKCNKLLLIDLSHFITHNITNMSYMFDSCSLLTSLDLSNFKNNNITNMSYAFNSCSSLVSLILTNFNTEKVTNMSFMFNSCSSLLSLNLSDFHTNNVTNMSNMFSKCSSLIFLDLSNFNTNNVNNMTEMFYGCSSLNSLDLSTFNTTNVNNMAKMFSDCSSLSSINLSNFNTNNVKDMSDMFYNCSSLNPLDISNFNTNNVINMSKMFSYCSSLVSLNLSNFNTINVNNMNNMFSNCISLISLDLSNFNTNNVQNYKKMFDNINKACKIITSDNNILHKMKGCKIF